MRFFLYEYLCSGAAGPAAATLRAEGWAMLSALLEDFGRLRGATVETLLDRGLHAPADVVVHEAAAGGDEATFRKLAAEADGTLVVAPESDGVLSQRLRWVEESGGRSLGSTPAAAALAGDKLILAPLLMAAGVPTPPTAALPGATPSFPAVCKPRFGAGSQATFLVRDKDELAHAAAAAGAEGWYGDLIVQPHVPGRAASVAVLVGPGLRLALPAAAQHLSADGRFHYLGGELPQSPEWAERAERLALRAVECVPGLHGYVGVDLVLGPTAADDAVIEINPRLTTSYVGLRALARFNLADALLAVAEGRAPPGMAWRPGPARFTADGRVVA